MGQQTLVRPRLALVPGEPAGVGPELCARALQRQWDAELVVFGDRKILERAAAALGHATVFGSPDGEDLLVEVAHPCPIEFGTPDPRNAGSVIAALEAAATACLRGECDGLVTGPVHKAAMSTGLGIPYRGTTELLAAHAGCEVVMMLANEVVRVALATTHLPLRAVPGAITRGNLQRTLRILHAALREDFGIADPLIAVLGINPHAGEAGHLGNEEIEVIEPVLAALRSEGMRLHGPLAADTAFLPGKLAGFDAVLAMYHDQGLPVLKYASFGRGVNVTLGLPFVRTSVDHGTALDLAGTGRADAGSLVEAVRLAIELAQARG